jgi:hypothetical protein
MSQNYDASVADRTPLCCLVCDRLIPDTGWFARIRVGDGRAAFCCPRCVEKVQEARATYEAKFERGVNQ